MTEPEAFQRWLSTGGDAKYHGAFTEGWSDYWARRGDFRRRSYGQGARGAYLAGRKWAAWARALKRRAK